MNKFNELLITELQEEIITLKEVEAASDAEILEAINSDERIQAIKNQDIELYQQTINKIMTVAI